MEQRLSLVTLGVDDLAAARAFYGKLGWREGGPSSDDVVFYQLGGIILGLYGRAALAEEMRLQPAETKGRFGGIALAYNARSKDEVDAVLAEAEAAGGRILKSGEDVFWGGYSGYFADPEGHVWEIAWNPHFPIAADGTISLPG